MTLALIIMVGFVLFLQALCLGAIALLWDQGTGTLTRVEKLAFTVDQEIDQANKDRAKVPLHAAPPPRAEPAFYLETKL